MPIIPSCSLDLRHYGASEYDPSKFCPISDRPWGSKPNGGLWTSPIDSSYGWVRWCKDEDFRTDSLNQWFDIRFTGAVLCVDGEDDLNLFPWRGSTATLMSFGLDHGPSFVSLVLSGIGAIYLTAQGQIDTRYSIPKNLYGWDCESVLILNPNTITPIPSKNKALYEQPQQLLA